MMSQLVLVMFGMDVVYSACMLAGAFVYQQQRQCEVSQPLSQNSRQQDHSVIECADGDPWDGGWGPFLRPRFTPLPADIKGSWVLCCGLHR